ncbi:hypothetical protein [Trichothermofontia sp.]
MAVELLMIDLDTVHHAVSYGTEWLQVQTGGLHHLASDGAILAQQFNQDVFADIRKGFNHFVQTGQVWALLIGFVLGYLFKSATSY